MGNPKKKELSQSPKGIKRRLHSLLATIKTH